MEVYFRNVQFQNKRKMMHGTYLFREKTTTTRKQTKSEIKQNKNKKATDKSRIESTRD